MAVSVISKTSDRSPRIKIQKFRAFVSPCYRAAQGSRDPRREHHDHHA